MRILSPVFALVLVTLAVPCQAGVDLPAVDACIAHSEQMKSPPTACVDAEHAECAAMPDKMNAAATVCFSDAREAWTDGISRRMEELQKTTSEDIAAIARIELKYDLLASLVQCDRMEELALLKGGPNEDLLRQKIRCAATASGLAYIRLVWRSRNLK